MVRFIFLEIAGPSLIDFLQMLTAPCPPPSLFAFKECFRCCENHFVRYCFVRVALVEDSAPFAPGVASEVLVFSSIFLVFAVWPVLFWCCLCLRRYLRMSVPCVSLSVFTLCSRPLLCPLQLKKHFDTVSALLLHLSHFLRLCGCLMLLCFR